MAHGDNAQESMLAPLGGRPALATSGQQRFNAKPSPTAERPEEEEQIKALLRRRPEFEENVKDWEWTDILRERRLGSLCVRKDWLVKSEEEAPEEFDKRARLSNHAPKTPIVESRITGAVFDEAPAFEAPEALKAFIAHPRRKSTSDLAEFVKRATRIALYKGQCLAVIDRAAAPDGGKAPADMSVAEAEAAGIDKPYAVLVQPENILDWRFDEDQQPIYVRITSGPVAQPDGTSVETIREIALPGQLAEQTAGGIQVWTVTVDKEAKRRKLARGAFVVLRGNLVAAGRLPVAVCRCDPIDGMRGVATLGDAAIAERRLFNALSNLQWVLWKAGGPLLWIRTLADLAELGVGVNRFIKLKPGYKDASGVEHGAEEIGYSQIDPSVIQNLQTECTEAAKALMDQLGMSVRANQAANGSGDGASSGGMAGVSIAYDFELGEANTLKEVAATAQRFALDLLVVAGLEMGAVSDPAEALGSGEIEARYSTDFTPRSSNGAVTLAQAARSLFGPDHPTTIYALNQASTAIMADASQGEVEEAREANKAGAFAPEPPDVMGGGFTPRVVGKKPEKTSDAAVPRGPGAAKAAG